MSEEPKLSQLDLEIFKQAFAEHLATTPRQVEGTAMVSLTGDEEITRQWEDIGIDRVQMFEDCLKKFTSAKNVSEQNKNGIRYVDDPMVNRDVRIGRYRQAFLQRIVQGDTATIIQKLRRGWVEQIPATPADWTDARLEVDKKNTGVGRYFHFKFVGVNPEKMESLISGLSGATYTDPVINGEVHTGTFTNFVVSGLIADDGSGTIDIFMGDIDFQLSSFDFNGMPKETVVRYVWNYPAVSAQALIASWKVAYPRGSGVTANYDTANNYCDLILRSRKTATSSTGSGISSWNCRYKTTVAWHWGLSKDEAYNLIALTPPPQGTEFRAEGPREDSDGTFSVWLYTTARSQQQIPEYVSELGPLSVEKTSEYIGSADGAQLPLPGNSIQGFLYRKSISKNEDCTYNERKTTDESVALVIGPVITGLTVLEKETEHDYLNSRTLHNCPASAQGHVYRSGLKINRDGSYSGPVSDLYSIPLAIGPVATGTDAFGDTYDTIYHAYRASVSAPNDVQGSVYDADNRVNADATYEGVVRHRLSHQIYLPKSQISDSALDESFESMYNFARGRPVAPDYVQGKLYEIGGIELNRDNTYNGRLRETDSKEVTIGPVATGKRLSGSAYETQAHNARALPSITRVQGRIYGCDVDFNRDGTYDINSLDDVAHPVEFGPILIRSSIDEMVWMYGKKNVSNFQTPDHTAALYDDRVQNSDLNDYGLYDSVRLVSMARKPNDGNSMSWVVQGNNLVYELPGGAIYIMAQYIKTTIGWAISASEAQAAVATSTKLVGYSGRIVDAGISDPVLGLYRWMRKEWYKI